MEKNVTDLGPGENCMVIIVWCSCIITVNI